MKKLIISSALLAGVMTYAGGFRVSLQGVKQLAMAHTSAHASDASVAFFNPAGISFIPAKFSFALGGFGANSEVEYQNPTTMSTYTTENPIGTPIYAAATYKVLDNVSLGFSFTTPFGSTIQWPEGWAGQEMVNRMELKSFFFQPMVSFKLADWASVGASYIHATGKVDWDKSLTQLGGSLNINDEKASGSGFGLGFYFQPNQKWDVSVAYRSPVEMNAENGTATFSISPALYPTLRLNAQGQDSFTAMLPLVDEYTIGATYKVTPKWLVSADFNYHGWEKYESLTLDFANAPAGNQPTDPTVLQTPKNFHNSKSYRIGTQYMLTNALAGRLGYYFDESPYEADQFIPETPSFDAHVITGGLGYAFGKLGVDFAASYTMTEPREFLNPYYNFGGQAKAKVFTFGLGLSYNAF